ncbi:MAG: aldehyde dehydrogenase family protein, partial [Bacteroidota bacterium]|nr:aldehyde dehydrogenase family protein [Bacteroidota bacterium]
MTNEELTSAFEALRTAQRQQPASTLRERRALLAEMLCGLRDHEDALLEALHQDLGKPEAEARLTEFFPIRKEIAFMRKHLGDWMRPERRPTPIQLLGTRSEIVNQPKGVVLVIAPWNFPLLLTMKPVIAALAAGNRVMVKPPEQAPATSQVMAEWMQASLPADRVQVLLGGPEEAAHLTTLPFDHIFFTGGTVTGRKVIRAAAEHLTPLTLELGGKSPAIIDGTMNPDLVAGRVGWAKALNVGQVCIAPDYLLIKDTAV